MYGEGPVLRNREIGIIKIAENVLRCRDLLVTAPTNYPHVIMLVCRDLVSLETPLATAVIRSRIKVHVRYEGWWMIRGWSVGVKRVCVKR